MTKAFLGFELRAFTFGLLYVICWYILALRHKNSP